MSKDLKKEEINREPEATEAYGFGEKESRPGRTKGWIGLILAVVAWVAVFSSGAIKSVVGLQIQLWITMAIAVTSLVLCILGRKRDGFVSMIGMIVSGSLILFVVIGLIGTAFL